jgi:hypothetical protein
MQVTQHLLHVVVHYIGAGEPFKDDHAERSETVGHLKARVLTAFGLVEGPTPDGNTVTFTLYHGKTPLENLAQTLGEVAGDAPVLQLKLARQVIQG